MFEKYDPRKGKRLQLLNENGILLKEAENFPQPEQIDLVDAYKKMVLTRQADQWAVSLNRQGRLPTYPPVIGQEANAIGAAMALNKDDWMAAAFREMGFLMYRDVPLSQQYLYWLGNEEGSRLSVNQYHILPSSVPIASQYLHATGLAWAEQYQKSNRIAIAYVGDGGTSEGDFHEALNFAGVWNAPVIFYIQNNQWAISVPRKKQTASKTLAEKAFGYGFEGIQIDGNDIFAVYAAVKLASENARNGNGPTLIEGFTYRLGAHTTADDPTRYRSQEEVEEWNKKDPLLRLEKYLLKENLISSKDINALKEECQKQAKDAFRDAENFAPQSWNDTFQYTHAAVPGILADQVAERARLNQLITEMN